MSRVMTIWKRKGLFFSLSFSLLFVEFDQTFVQPTHQKVLDLVWSTTQASKREEEVVELVKFWVLQVHLSFLLDILSKKSLLFSLCLQKKVILLCYVTRLLFLLRKFFGLVPRQYHSCHCNICLFLRDDLVLCV